MKASGFIRATTDVLNATIKDCSPVAYLMSITQVLQARLANKHQKPNKGQPDLEVLAYCYAAILSTVPLAVVQSQAATVSTIGQQLIAQDCTETSAKYGV